MLIGYRFKKEDAINYKDKIPSRIINGKITIISTLKLNKGSEFVIFMNIVID